MSFYIVFLFILIILSSLCVILSKNPVQSVLFLILIFLLSTILFLILGAEFISLTLLIVYVGAISTLFLFCVMMLDIRVSEIYYDFYTYLPIGGFIGLLFICEIAFIFYIDFSFFVFDNKSKVISVLFLQNNVSNIILIASFLYNYCYFFIILASLVLFLAMIGVIIITNPSESSLNDKMIYENFRIPLTKSYEKKEIKKKN